jgi:hypothetical protein
MRSNACWPGTACRSSAGCARGKPLLLLVDQLEELFTICHDVEAQKTFGRLLTTLSAPGGADGMGPCRILLTLRTDHLARLESNEVLQPVYTRLIGEGNHLYLSAIAFADIHLAIAEPAKRVGLRFVPTSLVNRLASQTAGLASGLPLLQFALRRLWDTRPRDAAGDRWISSPPGWSTPCPTCSGRSGQWRTASSRSSPPRSS